MRWIDDATTRRVALFYWTFYDLATWSIMRYGPSIRYVDSVDAT